MKTLYLGLDPKNYPCTGTLLHYPVIRTVRIEGSELQQALRLWPKFTHIVFTSQSAVFYWKEDLRDKKLIAIGDATAKALQSKGLDPQIASDATQEGVIALLSQMDLAQSFLFWPRSRRARPHLTAYLTQSEIPFLTLDLYDTHFQRPQPVPKLEEIDEIVFTSPSTVEGFLKIYGSLPQNKKLTAIGPVTQKALVANFS